MVLVLLVGSDFGCGAFFAATKSNYVMDFVSPIFFSEKIARNRKILGFIKVCGRK
jgi:hypothetical protein